jgi:hypothetical protein
MSRQVPPGACGRLSSWSPRTAAPRVQGGETAVDFDKLASPLAAAYERYVQEGRTRGPLVRQTRMLGFVSVRERAKPVRVVVSLQCDPDVTPAQTLNILCLLS